MILYGFSSIWYNKKGFALLYALLVMLILTTVGITLLHSGTTEATIADNQIRRTQAMYAAEAGLEKAVAEIRNNYVLNPVAYSNNEDFERVQPGNVQTRYSVSVAHKGGPIYEVTSVGYAGNAKYTQKVKLEIIVSTFDGGYLEYAVNVYGSGSRLGRNTFVIGDIQIPNKDEIDDGLVFGEIVEWNPGFPALAENWYLPAGVPASPSYVINDNINDYFSFLTLWEAINEGHRHIKVNGRFTYCPAILGVLSPIDFQGAVIEFTGGIDINGNRTLRNATFVSEGQIDFDELTVFENVTVVSKNKNHSVSLGSVSLSSGLVVYSEGDIVFDTTYNDSSLIFLYNSLLIAKGKLKVGDNYIIHGSIICRSLEMGDNAIIWYEPQLSENLGTMIPGGIGGVSVRLIGWGEVPRE